MPRPGGHARYPRLIAAAVDADLFARLDDWAQHQDVTKSQLLRSLIEAHIPDLRKLAPRQAAEEGRTP
jgi:predicted DNA-binding protein